MKLFMETDNEIDEVALMISACYHVMPSMPLSEWSVNETLTFMVVPSGDLTCLLSLSVCISIVSL